MKYLFLLILFAFSIGAYAKRDIAESNELKIKGAIKKEYVFTLADIKKFPQVDLGEVPFKNHEGKVKHLVKGVRGVLLKQLLDSVAINVEKPKELSSYYFVFIASDGFKNVYSWNEIYNTEIGNKLYIVTEEEGKDITVMEERIIVLSMGDINTGSRYMRGLTTIDVRKVK
jgi:hypothetical protein